jgi:hypothetical protein
VVIVVQEGGGRHVSHICTEDDRGESKEHLSRILSSKLTIFRFNI